MTEEVDHLDNLEQIRQTLVDHRRLAAAKNAISEVIDTQAKIDSIQRAIDDEKKLLPPPTAVFGSYSSY